MSIGTSPSRMSVYLLLLMAHLLVACTPTHSTYFLTEGLNDQRAQRISAGMSAADVEAAIGKPHQRVRFDNLRATAWDYRYIDTWGYLTEFAVMIDDAGRVRNIVSARVQANDR